MARADQTSYLLGTSIASASAGSAVPIAGGEYVVYFSGTAGGATISLQMLAPDGSTWCPIQALAGSSPLQTTTLPFSSTQIYLPIGQVRVNVAGGSGSSVNARLTGIG